MYISKNILELLRNIKGFVGQDDRDVYCLIKQEIKNNPKYQGTRFMSEKKFHQCLEMGKYLDEHEIYDSKYNTVLELYFSVNSLKRRFKFHCYEKWYNTVLEDKEISRHRYGYLLKILIRHQKRVKENAE